MKDFLKKYAIILVSGVVALVGLAGIVLGVSRFSKAEDLLTEATSPMDKIKGLQRGVPVETAGGETQNVIPNTALLDQVKDFYVQKQALALKDAKKALHLNIGYNPQTGTYKYTLMPGAEGIFPEPRSAAEPYGFRSAYRQAVEKLQENLNCGSPPTAEDIEAEMDNLDQQIGFHAQLNGGRGGRGAVGSRVLSEQERRSFAVNKASDDKAKAIKIYADQECLDIVEDAFGATSEPPVLETMWAAQMSLWIQQDIVKAISEVNASAENVFQSPIKRIYDIDVQNGYYLGTVRSVSGMVSLTGRSEEFPDSFTGFAADDYWDMTAFKIDVVIDIEKIEEFIDAMYRQGHYVLYFWELDSLAEAEQASPGSGKQSLTEEDLYRYGEGSLVRGTFYFEVYLIKDFFHWGIVDTGISAEGKPLLKLFDGRTLEVDDVDQRKDVPGLTGLMPKTIRDLISGEEEDTGGRRRR